MGKSLKEKDQAMIWHPFTQMKTHGDAVPIVKAKGAWLYDEDGNKILDAVASWWVNTHGHSHPYIAEHLAKQAKELEHVIFAGFTHPPAVELAEKLLPRLPENHQKLFFSDNGSTAVEVALKMSFQYWFNQGKPRYKVLALKDSYHGDTFGAMSVSGRTSYSNPFEPNLFDAVYIPSPGNTPEAEVLSAMEKVIEQKEIAAFIIEPLVQGAEGMLMYTPETLDKLIALARKAGALVIADEVMTGFGRTGTFFASDQLKNKPDIICMSKGLTGGTMALGLTSCTNAIYEVFYSNDKLKTFFHGHSFTANPLACRTAIASLELFEQESTMEKIVQISDEHRKFAEVLEKHSSVENVRQCGTILAFDIYKAGEERNYFHSMRDTIYNHFLNKGILLRPLGNTLYILPPYCITKEELQWLYSEVLEFLDIYFGTSS